MLHLQIMGNIDMDFVDVPKQATNVGYGSTILSEGTLDSRTFTQPKEVHTGTINLRHNKPKKANTTIIPEGI
jgi:hypothetical protein